MVWMRVRVMSKGRLLTAFDYGPETHQIASVCYSSVFVSILYMICLLLGFQDNFLGHSNDSFFSFSVSFFSSFFSFLAPFPCVCEIIVPSRDVAVLRPSVGSSPFNASAIGHGR